MAYYPRGNYNLKGKKIKLLRCGCCEIINFKCEKLEKIAKKEMKEELKMR